MFKSILIIFAEEAPVYGTAIFPNKLFKINDNLILHNLFIHECIHNVYKIHRKFEAKKT